MRTKAAFQTMSSHKSWEWPTPKSFYEQLDAEFHFNFDPCPLGGEADGRSPLFVPWKGRRVFCNPPYGPEIPKFLERAKEAELAVFLLPARVDTRWFHDVCLPHAKEIRFIKGRLRFGDEKYPAPFPSMVFVFELSPVGTCLECKQSIYEPFSAHALKCGNQFTL